MRLKNALFLAIFGIVFVAIGIYLLISGNELAKRCTEETVGTVVEIVREESTDSDGYTDYTYYPVIKYQANNQTVSKKSSTGSGSSGYNVNDKVEILYNPNNVEEYIIKGDKSSNFIGIIFVVVGVITVGAGAKKLLIG